MVSSGRDQGSVGDFRVCWHLRDLPNLTSASAQSPFFAHAKEAHLVPMLNAGHLGSFIDP